jgi:glycerol-3-phosphate acyltransferase PlsY
LEISFYNEFKRKATHLVALSIPIGHYQLHNKLLSLLILTPVALGAIALDIIRLKKLPLHGLFNQVFGPMLREHERTDFAGSSYILSASVFTIFLFEESVAIAAISYIILGDIAAALIGRRFGKTKILWNVGNSTVNWNKRKSLEGSLSCFLSCIIVALVVPHLPLWVGAIGALVATLVEVAPLPINDNFSVPLISGLVMHILIHV